MTETSEEGSQTPYRYRSIRKRDLAVLPYKKRVLRLGSNDTQKVRQIEMSYATYISRQSSSSVPKFGVEKDKSEIHPSKKISSSTTFDKDEVSASVSLLKLRDSSSGKLPLAMTAGNEASVKKSEEEKIPVKGPRSIRIRCGNQIGIIRSDLPPGDGVSKDGGSGVGDTKQADKPKVIENEVAGDDRSNEKEPPLAGDGHVNNGTPGAVGDRNKANDARTTGGKGIQESKGKGVMKQEGGNEKSTGNEPQGDGNGGDGSPIFVDGKQTDKIKEVMEYEGGRGGGNTGSEPADDAKDDEPGTFTGDGKTASKRKEVTENKVGGGGSTSCEPQGDNDCKDDTTNVVGDRKQSEKIKVIEHGGGCFLPIEMAVEGMNAEDDHEKQELAEKEDGGSEDNSNSAPGEEQNNKDKYLPGFVVNTTVYANNEPDVVEHGKQVHLAERATNIEGSSSRLPADGTLTQSLVLEDGSCLSPADSTDEHDKIGNSEGIHEQGQVVAVEDASDDKNNRNMEPGREEETIDVKKTVDDIVSTKVCGEVKPEGGQDERGNETDMIIGEEKTHEADPVTKLVGSGGNSSVDTTIKTRNDDNIEDLNEQKKNLTEDGGNEGGVVINELAIVEQDAEKGKKIVDGYVVSTIVNKAGSGRKEHEGGQYDCDNNPPDVSNGGKLKQADQVTNSAGCGANAPPTNFTLGRGGDANTEGNHEERIQKASFLLPDGGRGTDSPVAPAGGYIVDSSGYKPSYGISNIQMLQDAKTISSGKKRTHNSHDQGEVSQDTAGGGDAVGQKGRKKYKDGSNEVSGIDINTPSCNELPEKQASHTFRLFGVDIDVPEREVPSAM